MSDTLIGAQNQFLNPNGSLFSANGQFQLVYQLDGNLVIYNLGDHHKAIWSTNTANTDPGRAVMQGDGNFVVYGQHSVHWTSNTQGRGSCNLIMQNDGNLVIYQLMAPVWHSK